MLERSMITWSARALAGLFVCACQTADHAPGAPLPVDSAVPDSMVTDDASLPADASVLPEVRRNLIAAGFAHTCMLRDDGSPVCWGAGGPNDPIDHQRHVGQSIAPEGERFTQIVAGDYHTCGLREDGTIHCWGEAAAIEDTPSGSFVFLTAGQTAACALDAQGRPTCWGTSHIPDVGDRGFVELSYGGPSTCGVSVGRVVECWRGTQQQAGVPQNVHELEAGYECACGIDSQERAVCWGANCFDIQPGSERVLQITLGISSLCAIAIDRRVICSGALAAPALHEPVVSVAVGNGHACARTLGGRAQCWGSDRNGSTMPPAEVTD